MTFSCWASHHKAPPSKQLARFKRAGTAMMASGLIEIEMPSVIRTRRNECLRHGSVTFAPPVPATDHCAVSLERATVSSYVQIG